MKKRYLFIYGPLGGGGAERVLLDILSNFDYTNYSVDLCLLCPEGILYSEIPKEVNIIALYPSYTLGYRLSYHLSTKLGLDYFLKSRLQKKIQNNYDVVISFLEGLPLKLQYIADLWGRQYSWVHVDLYNFPYEKNQFFCGEEEKAYNSLDSIICVANDTEIAFHNRFPSCKVPTRVIYNPIDFEKIERMAAGQAIHNERFTVVTMGRLTQQKRMDRIVRLAARLKALEVNNVKFQIIGEGELREELENQIRELGVIDSVELLGFMKNPFPYIQAADLMVCCSLAEGFCLAICEAMVLGVPVISTRTAGPVEILQDKYGLLCEHDDDSIFDAFMAMFSNIEKRNYYSEIGAKRVKDFAVENTIQQIYSL